VDIDIKCDEAKLRFLQDLVVKATQKDALDAEENVRSKWRSFVAVQPKHKQNLFRDEPPEKYWRQHYHAELALVVLVEDTGRKISDSSSALNEVAKVTADAPGAGKERRRN
jgi:hypothetical protein